MRKFLSLVLVALLALTMVPAAFAEGENVVTIAMGTKPNLDIHWNAGSTGAWLIDMMYEGLYRTTDLGYELAGATEVTVNDDATVWTFKLREDAVWSDGKPVTAADYVYSMQRLVDPEVSSTYMLDYGQFLLNGAAISNREKDISELGVTAIDDYTLEVKLEATCTFFDAVCCYSTFYPLRADCVTEDGVGDWAWDVEKSITNGAMKMVECDPMQQIVLEKSETYYGKDNVKTDKVVVKLCDDDNTSLQLFENGDVDLITAYPSEETARVMEAGYYHAEPSLNSGFLLVNNNKEPLSDPRVRTALSMVMDREFLAEVLMNGIKTTCTSYIGAGFPGTTDDIDFASEHEALLTYDVEGAQALLAEAGFPGGEGFPAIECTYAQNANNQIVFEYLQSVWEEELGLTVTLTPLEGATMTELRDAGNFDITIQNWGADYIDASNMLSIFYSSNFINAGRYNSETFDGLYDEALKTTDRATRIDLLHQAEATLIADMGTIPLYHGNAVCLYRDSDLADVVIKANGKVDLLDLTITK